MDKNIEELIEKGKMIDSVYAKFANTVVVRPYMNNITGGFLSSAIFERILFFSRKYEKVWMFTTPSKDKDYQEGKSWCEVFNISLLQFNTALKRFAFKLGKTKNKINKEEALVIYYRGKDNKTYYSVNWEVYHRKLAEIDNKVLNYLVNGETAITKVNGETAITKVNGETAITKVNGETAITNTNESLKESRKESINNRKISPLITKKEKIPFLNKDIEKNKIEPVKKDYSNGEYKPVWLTKKEYQKLVDRFGKEDTDDKVCVLSKYKKYGRYTDHYSTLVNWLKKDMEQTQRRKDEIEKIEEELGSDSRVDLRKEKVTVMGRYKKALKKDQEEGEDKYKHLEEVYEV